MHNLRTGHIMRARTFNTCHTNLERNEPDGFLGVDRLLLLVIRENWLEVKGVQVRIVQKADDTPPGASDAVGVEFRKRWRRVLDHHRRMRRASKCGREAIGSGTEEGLIVVRVEAAMCALSEGTEVVAEHNHDALDLLP